MTANTISSFSEGQILKLKRPLMDPGLVEPVGILSSSTHPH